MTGGKNKIHIHPKHNSNGFDKNPEHINREGRPISFKKEFKRMLENDTLIWVEEEDIKRREIDIDGFKVQQVGIELAGVEKILIRLNDIVLNGSDKTALDAIKFIWEQIDGRSRQSVEVMRNEPMKIGYFFPKEALDDGFEGSL